MKIYLDLFFLFNTAMNFFVLVLESMMQKRRLRIVPMLMASILGAAFAVIFLVFRIHRWRFLFLILYGIGTFLLVRVAFGKTTAGALVRNAVIFFVSGSILNGVIQQAQCFFEIWGSGLFLIVMADVALVVAYRFLPHHQRWNEKANWYYDVRLTFRKRRVRGVALMDTGNQLCDPETKKPVILCTRQFLSSLWKEEPDYRYIRFHSVGKEEGVMPVFTADQIEVKTENGRWVIYENPSVGICEDYVSVDGEYEVILHPAVLEKKKN